MGERWLTVFPDQLVSLDPAPAASHPSIPGLRGSRRVRFPLDRSVGSLYVRDRRPLAGASESPFDPSLWQELGSARGEVLVPVGKELGLQVSYETSEDLTVVASLDPGALQALSLARTRATDESLREVAGMPLLDLNLAGTAIGDDGVARLGVMHLLQTLDLWGTRISDRGLGVAGGLESLRTLDLWGTRVTDAGLRHLTRLASLTRLYVPGPRVTAAGLAHIGRCRSLRALDLSGARVGDGLAMLEGLQSLEVLYLWDSDVTDEGLWHLRRLPALTEVDLGRNPVTDEGL
ncbi:MAG: leucine-rich repeat domain-containing protein, partial [Actinomycetota bacterium]